MLNVHTPYNRVTKYMKQKLLGWVKETNTLFVVRVFITHPSLYSKMRENIRSIEDSNQFELIDIYRTFQPGTLEYIAISSTDSICTKIDKIICHEILSKY